MSIRLYHCKDTRSFRALWMLEELGCDYELIDLPFPPRSASPGYLEINPLGTVPALVDGDLVMTESSAICQYLADQTDLSVAPGDPDYGRYLDWLHRADATLTFPLALVYRYGLLEPEARRLPQAVDDYSAFFLSRLRSVEQALQTRDYLCADRFTAADVAVHFALYFGAIAGFEPRYKPRCADYLDRLKQRPAFQRALARQYA